jgi:hypothetical protein
MTCDGLHPAKLTAAPFAPGEAAGVDEDDRLPGRPRILQAGNKLRKQAQPASAVLLEQLRKLRLAHGLLANSVGAAALKLSEPVNWNQESR